MPRIPQRTLDATIRPLLASVAVAACLVALAGGATPGTTRSARAAARVGTAAQAASSWAVQPLAARPPAHVTRSVQRPAWVRPAPGPVTSWYGRRWGGFHPGIDIGAPFGAPVVAITAGRVVAAGWMAGYGRVVRVRVGDLIFFYPHLSRILRRHGAVHAGDLLGRVGSSGFSTGPHLHIEIRRHGHAINPGPILRAHGIHLGRKVR